jgi:hypothetical protein
MTILKIKANPVDGEFTKQPLKVSRYEFVNPDVTDYLQPFRDHWAELHTKTDATPEWLEDWIARIPSGCGCGESFDSILLRVPPRFGEDWFEWTVQIHNAVNQKLGKPEMTINEAKARWQIA